MEVFRTVESIVFVLFWLSGLAIVVAIGVLVHIVAAALCKKISSAMWGASYFAGVPFPVMLWATQTYSWFAWWSVLISIILAIYAMSIDRKDRLVEIRRRVLEEGELQ